MQMLKYRDVKRELEKQGFECVRGKASHNIFKNKAGETISIPYHPGRGVSPVLVQAEFRKHNLKEGELFGNKK